MKRKSKNLLIAAVLLAFSSASLAQAGRSITLKEAVDLTLANSGSLRNDSLKIQEAIANIAEAKERRMPDVSVTGSGLFLPVKPTIDLKTGNSNGNGSAPPRVSEAFYGIMNVSVPLYTGGKLNYGIESAKLIEQAVRSDAETNRSQIILTSINACINLYKAYQAIELVKENMLAAQQRVKDLSNLEKNGLLARNDLMKAELQESNVELALLDAQSNYRIAAVTMNLMMGLPEQTDLVPDRSGLALPTSVKTLEEYEQGALKDRKEIEAITFRKKAAQIGVKAARANYYPGIALTGGYIAADIPKFLTITNAMNIGVGVKYDLSSLWKTKTKIKQAQLKVDQLETNTSMVSDNIRLDVNRAYQSYLVSVKKIEVLEKSVEQATENYRITKNKYDNALATTTELLDADVALFQSKLSVTNAKADSFLAYNKLLQVSGELTNY